MTELPLLFSKLLLLPDSLTTTSALVLIGVSFVTSAISVTFGLGGGVAMLIALLSLVPPLLALPLHGIIQVGSNGGRAWMLRSHIMHPVVGWLIPGTVLGVAVASLVFFSLPTRWLQLVLALFILWSVWAPKITAGAISDKAYLWVGAVASFGTMFLGATGPMIAAFINPARYGKDRTVATHAACMTIQHSVKVIAFGFLGFVLLEWIPLLIAMIVSGFAGTWIGRGLLQRFNEATFKLSFKMVLSAMALRLLYNAIVG